MTIRSGPLSAMPFMVLPYEVQVARPTMSRTTSQMVAKENWVLLPVRLPCDIAPLRDDLRFLQGSAQNLVTHELSFYARTDIRPRDRIKVLSNRRLAGPIGSWFEISDRMEPAETIAYVYCHAYITDSPI